MQNYNQNLKDIIDNIVINTKWLERYRSYVPKFIKEAKTKEKWQDWEPDVFREFFERSGGQCVSSISQGYFTHKEFEKIKINWFELAPLLKNIALNQDKFDLRTYQEIEEIIRKYTEQNRHAATHRLIAGLQPNILTTIVSDKCLNSLIKNLNLILGEEFISCNQSWFEKSYQILKLIKLYTEKSSGLDIATIAWQLYEYFEKQHKKHAIKKSDKEEIEMLDEYVKILKYKHQIILQGPPGTGKTKTAKEIAKRLLGDENIERSEQFKIIQFHPSYSYEDFVRGISSSINEDGYLIYQATNKVLGEFAHRAKKNYDDSLKSLDVYQEEQKIKVAFEQFIEHINDLIDENNGFYYLTQNIGLIRHSDTQAFRYQSINKEGWRSPMRMLYKDIIQAYLDRNQERQDIKNNLNLSGLARQHASYFIRVLNLFKEYLEQGKINYQQESIKEKKLKNYILIIDEANRANLPTVLGELIYALEYRGEDVESIYEVDGSNIINLPPNFYIIGTMNTADRSTNNIDYAIRRRFSFINILPKLIMDKDFRKEEFIKISELFIKKFEEGVDYNQEEVIEPSEYLSLDFNPRDVWLGHSYFIAKDEEEFNLRLKYEIKPILIEYVKDGILKDTAIDIIKKL